jgi:hypothetical protein
MGMTVSEVAGLSWILASQQLNDQQAMVGVWVNFIFFPFFLKVSRILLIKVHRVVSTWVKRAKNNILLLNEQYFLNKPGN